MSTTVAVGRVLSVKNKVGLVLAGLLGLADLSSPFLPTDESAEAGPPMGVLVADAVLGLITIVAVIYTWRTANRVGARIVAGSRIISVLTAVPAFFVPGVPAAVVALVAAVVVVTIATVMLVLARPRPA
jgi:hypothetical protein